MNNESDLSVCRLCGDTSVILKSHIIPKAFHREVLGGLSSFYMLSENERIPSKETARQLWDRLLCERCERLLKTYEDYVLEKIIHRQGITCQRDGQILRYSSLDYQMVKLYQLSIIWRASVAKIPFFQSVRLGPHEQVIRRMLNVRDPGEPGDYPCVIFHLYFQSPDEYERSEFIDQPVSGFFGTARVYSSSMAIDCGCILFPVTSMRNEPVHRAGLFRETAI
jgi:hypothetical protein